MLLKINKDDLVKIDFKKDKYMSKDYICDILIEDSLDTHLTITSKDNLSEPVFQCKINLEIGIYEEIQNLLQLYGFEICSCCIEKFLDQIIVFNREDIRDADLLLDVINTQNYIMQTIEKLKEKGLLKKDYTLKVKKTKFDKIKDNSFKQATKDIKATENSQSE